MTCAVWMLIWYLWHLQIFLFGWLGCAVISIPGLVNTHAWLNNLLLTAKSIINPVGCSAWHQPTSKIILDLKHLNFWWAKSETLNNTSHNIWQIYIYHQISSCFSVTLQPTAWDHHSLCIRRTVKSDNLDNLKKHDLCQLYVTILK